MCKYLKEKKNTIFLESMVWNITIHWRAGLMPGASDISHNTAEIQ